MKTYTGIQSRLSHLFPGWLVLFTLGHFSHHLLTALPVPLLPFIRDNLSLDYARSGLILSVFSITYGLSQLPAGWLADRLGPRILMSIGICGVALGGILLGVTASYALLLVSAGLMGLLGGGYHPSAPPLVSSTVAPRNRGRALGIHAIGGSASFFVAPLIGAAMAAAWGWRSPFLILAIPTLLLGVVLYFRMARLKPITNIQRSGIDDSLGPSSLPGTRRELTAFMALASTTVIIFMAATSFVPLLLVDHLGLTEETAAATIAIIFFTGIFASPVGGFLADRMGKVPLLLAASLALAPVIYLMAIVPHIWGMIGLLVVFGVIIAFTQVSAEAHIVGNVPWGKCSSVLGVYYFANMAGGGILTPTLGSLIDHQGFYLSFSLLSGVLAVAVLGYAVWSWRQRWVKTT